MFPPHREIRKTAIGAESTVEWEHRSDISELLTELISQGYEVLAIEQATPSTNLVDFSVKGDQKYAVILGHEINGVSEEAMALASRALEIPQYGTKHSLNVSVTAGIVFYQLSKQLGL